MSELEGLRQEAEQLKSQIRVSHFLSFLNQHDKGALYSWDSSGIRIFEAGRKLWLGKEGLISIKHV